jgi:hypothetical protein
MAAETSSGEAPEVSAADAAERARIAAALERVRAGVRQRQGELATGPGTHQQVRMRLLELKAHEFVQQPIAMSARPLWGRLLVLARKAFFKAFMKWYLHPVLQQQNRYNQVSSQLLQELAETVDQLRRRVAAMEERTRRGDGGEGPPGP